MIASMSAERPELEALPAGVVTFLLTDVAGSADLWTTAGPGAASLMARQAEIIAEAVRARGGRRPVEQGEGDSVVAVFDRASDALRAAVDAQVALVSEPWDPEPVRVRMAIHTGEAEFRDEHTYGGAAIIRCARLRELAVGGQVLVSTATAEVVADRLPEGASLVAVGEVGLRGLPRSERVHQLVHEGFPATVANLGRPIRRLGTWPTPLVGRVGEQRELIELLDTTRLVTINGTGGAGKTRLAHAVATELEGRGADVAWVELARISSDADVASAVARACGASEAPGVGPLDVLVAFLGTRETLVVLDNCEHVLDACAALADEIVRRTPRSRMLTTSREPLGVAGEVTWRIPSMAVPPDQALDPDTVDDFDAVALFVERAQAADPMFMLDADNAADVARICRRLDGLPLAIELAAARLRSMSLRAVTDGLDDRFRLLTGGVRTALPRQQALLASVEWSYGLLDDDEQELLRRLAVFVAPFAVEAAETIAAEFGSDRLAVFDQLCRLVDKSLVHRLGDRYALSETIRQFGLEQARHVAELEKLRDAHLRWCVFRADRWALDREILTEGTLGEIAAEAPDLLAAFEWSLRDGSAPAAILLWPLGRRWLAESTFAEASRVAETVLRRFEPYSSQWLDALAPMAAGLMIAGERSWVKPTQAVLSEPGRQIDDLTRSHLEWAMATGPSVFIDAERRARLRSFIDLWREQDNSPLEYSAAGMLAYACASGGSVEEADRLCRWLDRRLPADADARSFLDISRGYLALLRCEFDAAWNSVADRILRRRPQLIPAGIGALVGAYTADRGRLEVILSTFELARRQGRGAPGGPWGAYQPWHKILRAVLAIFDGKFDEADSLLTQREADLIEPGQSPLNERLRVQMALARGDVDAAAARCRALTPLIQLSRQQPYPAASFHLVLADVAAENDDVREAEKAVQSSLGISTAELPLVSVDGLELLAVLLARRDRSADAGRLLGAAEAFRDRTGYRFRFPFRSVQVEQLRPQLDGGDLAAGAEMSMAEAIVLAQGTRGKRGRPRFGWDSLTPTEARIAELVAAGCSNAEIAGKLFVGLATVKTHLVHVYGKLGLRSRAELAAYAARREASC